MKKLAILITLFFASTIGRTQEVKINNNLVIEADGTIRFDSSATVWDDLRVGLDKGSSSASMAYIYGSSGPQIYFFKNTGLDAMSFTVQLPHSWKAGSTIYPHLHWLPKNNDANASHQVIWNFDYTWVNYNTTTPEVFPAITTISIPTSGPFIANTHLITPLTIGNVGLDATGKTVSSLLICRIWRNSSAIGDNYSSDCGAISLDFHYEMDTFGSRSEYSK